METKKSKRLRVKKAEEAYEKAARNLIAAVRAAYPVGCRVRVAKGRSLFIAEVTGHSSSWWCDPGTIHAVNVETGKSRRFDFSSIVE